MSEVVLIGAGFVADLYMRSFALYPEVKIRAVWDRDPARLEAFCTHWSVPAASSLEAALTEGSAGCIVLNLTNPASHFDVSTAALTAGHHVYSEKPLGLSMAQAQALHDQAADAGLLLSSAPCSVLGEAAQTLIKAVRDEVCGIPRLVYAELDDGFIPQARYGDWLSDSGAPWPARDEFEVGCTLEHAGYYLTWLIAAFGPVARVVAASAAVIPDKEGNPETPDVSVATLFFASGMVARLTCSIVAPHDHQIRVIGDAGVIELKQAWDNDAKPRFRKRVTIRRRLMELPVGRKLKIAGPTHPKVKRWGAAAMNFALGPMEMLEAIEAGRPCRLSSDFALHLNEVTLAIQNAGDTSGAQDMQTRCDAMEPMPWAR
ncbi:Gfo/Idh/MocA family protein [Primorskyibacter sp. S187A]|uniref:Gfo/Idh/MocA family protein n=1 Tax=Primorskyibacter sp. S187A TaxID=3415130 RepID=UPI003C7AFAC3